tara:strand:+ start:741 stop:1106 length:366 start_codon:yes stop_codon:yes gene_type:complete
MSKDSDFLDDLKGFKDGEESGLMPAVVTVEASSTGSVQNLDVCVWKSRGQLKLSWTKKGSGGRTPQIPRIAPRVKAAINQKARGGDTVLTRGLGSNMRLPEQVLKFLKILADNGIMVNYSV